jgi:FAD/FMN-containing dehydrogenase
MVLDSNTFANRSSDYRQAVAALARCLHGRLIEPGDLEYDEARRVWNGSVDRYPALIVRAADVTDVLSAVNFARQQGLELAIRSGGHSLAGAGTTNGGLVLDLSGMKTMTVDLERRTARVDTGLTFGEVSERLQEYGLAIPAGDTASVGVGGLTLGGGIGWLVRKYGLTIDSLLSADIVTADGRLLTTSTDENPDLFWAIRGGGGNFGVVTSFEFRVHPAGMVIGGAIIYDTADGEQVLRGYVDYAAQAPDELSTIVFMMAAPPLPFIPAEKHGKPIILITLVHVGDLEEGQRVVQPLRELGTPIADISGPMPYALCRNVSAHRRRKCPRPPEYSPFDVPPGDGRCDDRDGHGLRAHHQPAGRHRPAARPRRRHGPRPR